LAGVDAAPRDTRSCTRSPASSSDEDTGRRVERHVLHLGLRARPRSSAGVAQTHGGRCSSFRSTAHRRLVVVRVVLVVVVVATVVGSGLRQALENFKPDGRAFASFLPAEGVCARDGAGSMLSPQPLPVG